MPTFSIRRFVYEICCWCITNKQPNEEKKKSNKKNTWKKACCYSLSCSLMRSSAWYIHNCNFYEVTNVIDSCHGSTNKLQRKRKFINIYNIDIYTLFFCLRRDFFLLFHLFILVGVSEHQCVEQCFFFVEARKINWSKMLVSKRKKERKKHCSKP